MKIFKYFSNEIKASLSKAKYIFSSVIRVCKVGNIIAHHISPQREHFCTYSKQDIFPWLCNLKNISLKHEQFAGILLAISAHELLFLHNAQGISPFLTSLPLARGSRRSSFIPQQENIALQKEKTRTSTLT